MLNTDTEGRLFAGYARMVVRGRWWVLLGSLALTASLISYAGGRLRLDNSLDAYIDPASDVAHANEELRSTFGND